MAENQDDKPVNYNDMIAKFGFDENGPSHIGVIMKDPLKAATVYLFANDVENFLNKEYKNPVDSGDNENKPESIFSNHRGITVTGNLYQGRQ